MSEAGAHQGAQPRPARVTVFALGEGLRAEDLLPRIEARFRVRSHRPLEARRVHLDTPDWRLRRSGASLTRLGNGRIESLELCAGEGQRPTRSALESEPQFVWDLPHGLLRERLEPLARMRRLVAQLDVRAEVHSLDVLDEREKIVVRLDVEEGQARSSIGNEVRGLGTVLRLRPLRGFDREFGALVSYLGEDLGLQAVPADDLERALAATGRDPHDEVPRWRVELTPRESSGQATRRVLRRFLEIMSASEAGVQADIDSEYLHDFRVAVRRSRSILGQLRGLFDPELAARAAKDLAWLGSTTTWLRDLDVFLLQIGERMRAGDELWMEFECIADSVREAREQELEKVRAALAGERWHAFRASWSAELGRGLTTHDPEEARRPISELASERIAGLHRKVLKASRRLDADSPIDDLHALRIRCKKLRYMTDAFGCLYSAKGLRRLVKRLKQLQELLGEFNDRHVQVETLRRFANELDGLPPGALFAMGRLMERYSSRAEALRPEILERLKTFARDQDKSRVQRLLSSSEE